MSNLSAGPVRNFTLVRRFSPPGAVWAAALFMAPFLNHDSKTALLWSAGSVVLIALFPWALVTFLDKRGDLRRGINRLGASPVILGAFGVAFMVLRIIRWSDGSRALAAVVFGMIAGYAMTVAVSRVINLQWVDVAYAASAIILPVMFLRLFPTGPGTICAIAAGLLSVGAMFGDRAFVIRVVLVSASVGVFAAGVFLRLFNV